MEAEPTDPHDELHLALLKWLRASRAAALFYVDKEGKRRRISLRSGKGRWEIAARMLMRMIDEIDRLEAEDARGGMVDTWRVPEASDAQAEAEAAVQKERAKDEEATPRELRAVAALARMIEEARIQAVQEHMKAQRELLGFIMDGQKQTTARLETLERSLSSNLKTVFDAYKTRAQIEGFIAGGGMKQQSDGGDPNERLVIAMIAQKMGMRLPAGFLGESSGEPASVAPGNTPDDPF